MNLLQTLAEVSTLPVAANGDVSLQKMFEIVAYIIAGALFILALKWLSAPTTARRGNFAGQIGMGLAIIGALLGHNIISYQWIIIGFVLGAAIGAPMAIW